jgi:hypothetical protein
MDWKKLLVLAIDLVFLVIEGFRQWRKRKKGAAACA